MKYRLWLQICILCLLFGELIPTPFLFAAAIEQPHTALEQNTFVQSADDGERDEPPFLTLASHIGGAATALAVEGNYLYLGFSYELMVLDVTDRSQPRAVATVSIPISDIALIGSQAYLVGREGVAILDVTRPDAPQILGQWRAPRTLSAVAVHGDLLLATGYNELYILTVSNSADPALLYHYHSVDRLEGVAADNHLVYLAGTSGLYLLDISEPTMPVEIAFIHTDVVPNGSPAVHDAVYFGGDKLFYRVELAAENDHIAATSIHVDGWVATVTIEDGFAYLANGFNGVQIWDVQDWSYPRQVATVATTGIVTRVAVSDSYLYVLDCDEGIAIYNVTDPALPVPIGRFTSVGTTYGVAVDAAFAYIAGGFNGELHLAELTEGTPLPSVIGKLIPRQVTDFALADSRLYTISGGLLQIIDTQNPMHPIQLATHKIAGHDALQIQGDYAYISDSIGNVKVLDISEPNHIVTVAQYPDLGHVNRMTLDEGYLYAPHKEYGLRIFAREEGGELRAIGRYAIDTKIYNVAVVAKRAYLALGQNGIEVVDLTHPTEPRYLSHLDLQGDVLDIAVADGYGFAAAGKVGLTLIDLRLPIQPRVIATYPTLDCAHQVLVADDAVYVADNLGGFFHFMLQTKAEGADVHLPSPRIRNDEASSLYAFIDANVIPMEQEMILPHQTILVADQKILAIGPTEQILVPPDAVRIPATGRYLLPGLADMHIHLRDEAYLDLLVANGVTTVRNMDGRPEHLQWRAEINAGERLGPRIFTSGPMIDEVSSYVPDGKSLPDRIVESPEGAAELVAEQQALGYDFIKIYDGLSPTAFYNLITAAQALSMPVVGHVPNTLSAQTVIEAGQRSIEHLEGYFGVYPDQLPSLIATTVENEAWNCPTLIMYQRFVPTESDAHSPSQQRIIDFVSPNVQQLWWLPQNFAEVGYEYRPVDRRTLEMVYQLYQANAPLLLGTDAPMPCAIPGFAVHQELQNLVDAGLTPYAALATTTVNAARFLNRLDEFGTITVGKAADLLLLEANPLVDIANTKKINGVMVNGQWLPSDVLDDLLAKRRISGSFVLNHSE